MCVLINAYKLSYTENCLAFSCIGCEVVKYHSVEYFKRFIYSFYEIKDI